MVTDSGMSVTVDGIRTGRSVRPLDATLDVDGDQTCTDRHPNGTSDLAAARLLPMASRIRPADR